ncbi:MAG: 16S rRNA (adenine(1518)-N(6)/adenine(1519)-N(6))-dimethyltransferase RsmA [Patescibacteria group bacterium]
MTKLGQHFLINKKKILKIVETLELKDGDTVIEIGPGHGELTTAIIERLEDLKIERFKIVIVEKDRELVRALEQKFKTKNKLEILEGDILRILPEIIFQFSNLSISNYKLVGNIPYYITGYLLRILGELKNKSLLIVLLIQKEVAERVCAKPSKMNLLAASVQFWAEPKIIGYVSKKDFRPQPKVDSAIIKLKVKSEKLKIKPEDYYKFIKILFKQPRKTILNNLMAGVRNKKLKIKDKKGIMEKLSKIGINPQARPQDLSLEEIVKLTALFEGEKVI